MQATAPEPASTTTGANPLAGRTCVVTGASSGIGRAVAIELAAAGARICGVARRGDQLALTAELAGATDRFDAYPTDLVRDDQLRRLVDTLKELEGGIDVLVHSAGTITLGEFESASVDDLDRQYAANVRAPFLLTQGLLPALRRNRGQIVFVNSTVGLNARANVSQFAATQHALKALADGLREEMNPHGVRVVNVYPGRTATPRQAKLHALEGKEYPPERLMQAQDVAAVVVNALALPRTCELTDVKVRPMLKH